MKKQFPKAISALFILTLLLVTMFAVRANAAVAQMSEIGIQADQPLIIEETSDLSGGSQVDASTDCFDTTEELLQAISNNTASALTPDAVDEVTLEYVTGTSTPDTRGGIFTDDTYVWIADHKDGLWRANKCDGSGAGQVNGDDDAIWDLWHEGDYIYAAPEKDDNKLWVYNDVTGAVVGSVATQNNEGAYGVYAIGDYAYLASMSGLEVYDVSTPASPTYETTVETGIDFVKVRGAGDYLYATDETNNYLRIFDISADPTNGPDNPELVGTYNPAAGGNPGWDTSSGGAEIRGLFVDSANDLVYFVNDRADLYIVDVSTPTAPTTEGYIFLTEVGDNSHPAAGVFVREGYAYVNNAAGNGTGIFYWLDVSTPSSPVVIDSLTDTSFAFNEPYAEGCHIHMASHDGWQLFKMAGWQPDNQIKNDSDASYIGDGIYNDTGLNQTKEQNVYIGETATFQMKVENDASDAEFTPTDKFTLKQVLPSSPPSDWTIQYLDTDGVTDITTSILNGTYTTSDLAPGSSVSPFTLKITPDRSVSDGTCLDVKFRAVSNECPDTDTCLIGAEDVVLARVCVGFASIGNYIWLDEDADGVQDAGEVGIPNVKVELKDDQDVVIATTYTDADGGYIFSNFPPATYTVEIDTSTLPSGLAANPTYDPDAACPGAGCDGATTVIITAGEEHMTADWGYNWATKTTITDPPQGAEGAIGDRVWSDYDGDGIQDPGEPGLEGVSVTIYHDPDDDGVYDTAYTGAVDGNGAPIGTGTTTTDANGNYIFDALPTGAYVIKVDETTLPGTPANYTQTGDPDEPGGVCSLSCDGQTDPIALAPGDVFVDADFGYQNQTDTNTIGDTIFLDASGDGTYQPATENGIPNVTVSLIKDTGGDGYDPGTDPIIATTITDANGNYSFEGIPDGDYVLWVNDTDHVLGEVVQNAEPDPPNDGGTLCGTCDSTFDVSITSSINTMDFGYVPPMHDNGEGIIGDTIFLDRDGGNDYDPGEGMEGVTVELRAATGGLIATTTTDENGNYYFGGLPDATYTVIVLPSTLPNGGSGLSNTVDPPEDTTPGDHQNTVTISSGSRINLDQDFGYAASEPGSITGTIWTDTNADGALDSGESDRYPDVTVALYDTNGNIVGTTTTCGGTVPCGGGQSPGDYTFAGLPPGDYTVDVTDHANILNGTWHSLGTPGADGESQTDPYTPAIVSSGVVTPVDFGYFRAPGVLGNYVWEDTNGNGIQDSGETGIGGILVTLTITYPNGDTVTTTTTTDSTGYYSFYNLLLDEDFNSSGDGTTEPTFEVTVDYSGLSGYIASPIRVGDGSNDSGNPDGEGVTVTQGETTSNVDFGFDPEPTSATMGGFGVRFNWPATNFVWWETSTETDTAGFDIQRATVLGGTRTTITIPTVPIAYGQFGGYYEHPDQGVQTGVTYYYWIIEKYKGGGSSEYLIVTTHWQVLLPMMIK